MFSEFENPVHYPGSQEAQSSALSDQTPCPASDAQVGEDVILEGIFAARLCKSQRSWESAFYVKIGANHPVSTSSTYLMY